MEKAVNHGINVPYTSTIANHRPPKTQNVLRLQAHVPFAMRRASANIIIAKLNKRLQKPHPLCAHTHNSMAEKDPTSKAQPFESKTEGIKNKELEEEESKKLPPPPEKPLPGDCCGSGCVRCVWDVYYEELEEYDKLYKTDSKPKSWSLLFCFVRLGSLIRSRICVSWNWIQIFQLLYFIWWLVVNEKGFVFPIVGKSFFVDQIKLGSFSSKACNCWWIVFWRLFSLPLLEDLNDELDEVLLQKTKNSVWLQEIATFWNFRDRSAKQAKLKLQKWLFSPL